MLRLFDPRRRLAGSFAPVVPAARLLLGGALLGSTLVGCNAIASRPATARKCLDPACNEHAQNRGSLSAGMMRNGVVPASGWMGATPSGPVPSGAVAGTGGTSARLTHVPQSLVDGASRYPIVQTGAAQPAVGPGPQSGAVTHADLTTPFAPAAPLPPGTPVGTAAAPPPTFASPAATSAVAPPAAPKSNSVVNWLKGPAAGNRRLADGSTAAASRAAGPAGASVPSAAVTATGGAAPGTPIRVAAQPPAASGTARMKSTGTAAPFDPSVPPPPAVSAPPTQRGYGPVFDPSLFEDVPRQ
jgi:hypothetical protein